MRCGGVAGVGVEPEWFGTVRQFGEGLQFLKDRVGVGDRELARRAAAMGYVLPRGGALAPDALPREETVVALTRACGCGEGEVARWVAVHRRLARDAVLVRRSWWRRVGTALSWRGIAAWPLPARVVAVLVVAVGLPAGAFRLADNGARLLDGGAGTHAVVVGDGLAAPPELGADWALVLTVEQVTLPVGSSVELGTGRVGETGDVMLAGPELAAAQYARIAVLPVGAPGDPRACADLPGTAWLAELPLTGLATGSAVCAATADRRVAVIVVDRLPAGGRAGTLLAHYTLWVPR